MLSKRTALFASALAALVACSDSPTTDEQPESSELPRILGPNDKADNFRSESAQEYWVRGTTTVTLEEDLGTLSEDERMVRVRELIPLKQVAIGYFLMAYLIDKSSHDDNKDYGGFKALTKNDSYESLNIQKVDELTYSFDFVQEVGGDLDLLAELGRRAEATPNEDGTWTMMLTIGKVSNAKMSELDLNNEWYRDAPWSDFDPTKLDAEQLEQLALTFEEQERSADAWIDYNRLVEDGTVDVSVFFGWDYHDAYHLKHSESTYNWLVRQGFESPVDAYAEYNANRAPLTKTIDVNGRAVEYRVTLWWGQPESETDPDTDAGGIVLENAMRDALARDEVIVFSGHSGAFYGFALANWRKTEEGDLDDSEIPSVEMPPGKYQIVLAEGCDTYAIGEAFWKNPAKADQLSLDIITTTSFSNAGTPSTVTDFLRAVAGTDGANSLVPMKYADLLRDMDSNSFWFQTMYGVHGIDDNPTGHPFANRDLLCGACSDDSACGGGGRCVSMENGPGCTYECTADSGCPGSFTCRQSESGGFLRESFCTPQTLACQ